jgi:hypothetical protein
MALSIRSLPFLNMQRKCKHPNFIWVCVTVAETVKRTEINLISDLVPLFAQI